MKSQLKKLYALLSRRDRIKLGILVCCMIVGGMLELVGIGIIPAFLGAIVFPEKVLSYPVVGTILQELNLNTSERLLMAGGATVFVIFVAKNGFLAFNYALQASYTSNRMADIRARLFSAYMNAPYPFFLQRNSAELLRNANEECNKVGRAVLMPLMQALMVSVLMFLIFVMLLIMQPVASLVMIASLGITAILFYNKLQRKVQSYGLIAMEQRRVSNQCVKQGLAGIKEARVLAAENSFVNAFWHSAKKTAKSLRFQQTIQQLGGPVLESAGVFTMLLVAVVLVWGFDNSVREAMPMLALFAVALNRMRAGMNQLMKAFTQLRYNLVSVDPVYDDLQLLQESVAEGRPSSAKAAPVLPLQEKISVENVSFYYENSQIPAVTDVNLTIPRGASVAFVGPTGAGKTTMVDLILGLLEPTSGRIAVDGTDIHSQIRGWQKNIGYVPQFIYLLDDSIKRNIALGIPDAQIEDDKLRSAVNAARLNDVTDDLPNGLETQIGERGVRLSGGQRQRIGIARALYHHPDVLLMDEATSSLDTGTEKAIVDSVNQLKGGRTIIMIAHRLTTVKNCDRLFFLKDGRLDAAGTYDELFETHEEFRVMAG